MTDKEKIRAEVDNFLKDPVFGKLMNHNAALSLARHIAQWQKKQMTEEVVEGTYDCNDIESWICFDGLVESTSKVGKKVKVIIIKEEEK